MKKYEVGKVVTGSVTGIEKYGFFVKLDEYYSGLVHISEISDEFVRNISDYVSTGETIKVKIMEINHNDLQAKLSIKNIGYRSKYKRKNRIVETPNGFNTLKENLSVWIEKKEKEITK